MNHFRLLLVGAVAFGSLSVGSLALAGARTEAGSRRIAKDATVAPDPSPFTVYDGEALLIRTGEAQWQITLDELNDPIVFNPVGGRSNIPLNVELAGRINLGLHGPDMALLVETDEGALYQAVLRFDRASADGLAGVIPNRAKMEGFSQMDRSALVTATASLASVAARLRLAFYTSTGLAAFGAPAPVSKSSPARQACAGGSRGCFLACDACCPAGTVPSCTCRIFGQSQCTCTFDDGIH